MTIETIFLNQQQQYRQQHASKRTIKRLKTLNNTQLTEQISANKTTQTVQLNTRFLAINERLKNNNDVLNETIPKIISDTTEEDIYQRPLPAKIKLIKLILESYLGKNLDLSSKQFNYGKASAQMLQAQQALSFNQQIIEPQSQSIELIKLDGKQYNQQEPLSITTLSTEQQQLNYTMQGEFILDNQKVSLNYQLNLSATYNSINKIETTAAALKDPLVIQFGARSIGYINDYTKLDINRNNKQDKLPIFSGDVGYLVFDKNQNNKVDDGSELFGPTSNNGFVELAQLDSNNNGFFDLQDDNFNQVYIWQPKYMKINNNEQNAKAQNLFSLSQAGIKAISLNAIATQFNFRDQSQGNNTGEINAQLTQTSFAITENNQAFGVHQIDVRL